MESEQSVKSKSFVKKVFSFRTYCETDIDPAHRKYSQLQAAIRYLLGKEPDLECRFLVFVCFSQTTQCLFQGVTFESSHPLPR